MPIRPSRWFFLVSATVLLLVGSLSGNPPFSPLPMAAAGNTTGAEEVQYGSGTADPLWQKAVALAARNAGWIPGLAVQRVEDMDGDWQVKGVEEYWIRISPDSSGGLDHELIKAIKDGKDRTEKERKKAAEEERKADERQRKEEEKRRREAEKRGEIYVPPEEQKRYEIFGGPLPFDPEIQDSVSVRRVTATDPPPGPPSIAFEFTQPLSRERSLRGIAWLDAETGAPIEGRFAPAPLPGRVKEMEMRMRFTTTPDGAWYPTELFIRAMGKFLFFKKRVQSTLTLSDYWWKEDDDG
ncbi:MAG: hypothetical protein KAY32_09920 [Candidatus Eisenbacteria sp.]|nr:hypothetical protein [Candidatus Eisenbacteria bacterium]